MLSSLMSLLGVHRTSSGHGQLQINLGGGGGDTDNMSGSLRRHLHADRKHTGRMGPDGLFESQKARSILHTNIDRVRLGEPKSYRGKGKAMEPHLAYVLSQNDSMDLVKKWKK
eukprot:PhM_4_TR7848/c0_g1_i1/m.63974